MVPKLSTKQKVASPVFAGLLLLVHFLGSYLALSYELDKSVFFRRIQLNGSEFFAQFIITGAFLYTLATAGALLLVRTQNVFRVAVAIFFLSLSVATLIGHDKYGPHSPPPEGFWGMFSSLLTERQPVLLLSILTLLGAIAVVYYIIRTFFKVSFEGTGIQIKLPGQTMYYMAIFPQTTWQQTGIELREGDKFVVELTGSVSPGGLQNFWHLKDYLKQFHQLQKEGKKDQWKDILDNNTWPYTGPEGYKEKWYRKGDMIGVLKNHDIYGSGNGLNDECMTVRGKPHNRVFGIIQNEEPKNTTEFGEAYEWERDKELLIELSDNKYPKTIIANRTGELWVVINDVDYARWDNTGMFFLRVTRHS